MTPCRAKGTRLTLACGHEITWPRPVTATGHVWCRKCRANHKIESVKP